MGQYCSIFAKVIAMGIDGFHKDWHMITSITCTALYKDILHIPSIFYVQSCAYGSHHTYKQSLGTSVTSIS